jgi:hypothetical protein
MNQNCTDTYELVRNQLERGSQVNDSKPEKRSFITFSGDVLREGYITKG